MKELTIYSLIIIGTITAVGCKKKSVSTDPVPCSGYWTDSYAKDINTSNPDALWIGKWQLEAVYPTNCKDSAVSPTSNLNPGFQLNFSLHTVFTNQLQLYTGTIGASDFVMGEVVNVSHESDMWWSNSTNGNGYRYEFYSRTVDGSNTYLMVGFEGMQATAKYKKI